MANIIRDIASLEASTYLRSMDASYSAATFALNEPDNINDAPTYLPSGTIPSPYKPAPPPLISTLTDHTPTISRSQRVRARGGWVFSVCARRRM